MTFRKKPAIRRNVSLARALSKLGHCSRTEALRFIRRGDVTVNGRKIVDPEFRCSLERDVVLFAGPAEGSRGKIVILMNKPAGVVTTRSDERGRRTVYDVLGDIGTWVFPVGRLDMDTTGMLIMTNDRRLGERLTNPDSHIEKTYVAGLDREPEESALESMRAGMTIGPVRLRPAKVKKTGPGVVELKIQEGKNRQIRRMCEEAGLTVESLCRTAIGDLSLGGLKPGDWRELGPDEIGLLTAARRTSGSRKK